MNLRVVSSAVEDLSNGFRFYETQVNGLGRYFLESLFSDIDSLRSYAGIHPVVFGYHRLLSKRFPYAVYYRKDSGEVIVIAILDCRRDPGWIRERLAKSG